MASDISTAYRFDLFESRLDTTGTSAPKIKNTTGTAAPKIKTRPAPAKPKLVPAKPRSKRAIEREEKAARISAVKILTVSVVMILLIGSLIFGRVKIMEISAETDSIRTQLKEAQSENIRLQSEVKAMYSISNISAYAEEKLGMIKKDCYQVNYFSVDNGGQAAESTADKNE